ncbi:MAG TPA: ABC transporter, partial [Flavitalea sp.]|nr:ABC transporter [Flavitalea sp.]
MKHLKAINKYFWKYRVRLSLGVLFIVLSNYFAILAPQLTGHIFDLLQQQLGANRSVETEVHNYDPAVSYLIGEIGQYKLNFNQSVAFAGIAILVFALLSGFFMFLMRQTIIVMSRHIEFD